MSNGGPASNIIIKGKAMKALARAQGAVAGLLTADLPEDELAAEQKDLEALAAYCRAFSAKWGPRRGGKGG